MYGHRSGGALLPLIGGFALGLAAPRPFFPRPFYPVPFYPVPFYPRPFYPYPYYY